MRLVTKIQITALLTLSTVILINMTGWYMNKFIKRPTPNYYVKILKHRKKMINSLHLEDYSSLINISQFRFNIFNRICNKQTLYFVAVISKPSNYEKRNFIRTTWGNSSQTNVKILFILGLVEKILLQAAVDAENSQFGDIIQGNFIDSYFNLTYKHTLALKYFMYYCPQAMFAVKIDDDVLLNIPAVDTFLSEVSKRCDNKNVLYCQISSLGNLYRAPENLPFCLRYFVVYPWRAAFNIYKEAQLGQFFTRDDVYFTGFLTKQTGTGLKNLNYTGTWDDIIEYAESNGTKGNVGFLVSPPHFNVPDLKTLWAYLKQVPESSKNFHTSNDFCLR